MSQPPTFASYTSQKLGVWSRLLELRHLYRRHSHDVTARAKTLVERLRNTEDLVRERTGIVLRGLRMLDVGPGQTLYQMGYFARHNDVTGIDLDVIPQGFDPLAYLRMAKTNGPVRTLKTVTRKLLGLDAQFRREVDAVVAASGNNGHPAPRRLDVRRMDAVKMNFPDASFDFVYSCSTFEHLPEPGKVIDEVVRVLKPGGGCYLCLHLYTSDSGCHDPRIFSRNRGDIPRWAHLRPRHEHKVRPNAYLNKIRLEEWRHLFAAHLPGCTFASMQYGKDQARPALREIRDGGELSDYSDEELLTVEFAAVWKKPG
jgi:SAM-dependent methyltransferase